MEPQEGSEYGVVQPQVQRTTLHTGLPIRTRVITDEDMADFLIDLYTTNDVTEFLNKRW